MNRNASPRIPLTPSPGPAADGNDESEFIVHHSSFLNPWRGHVSDHLDSQPLDLLVGWDDRRAAGTPAPTADVWTLGVVLYECPRGGRSPRRQRVGGVPGRW
jgi:hypothetical protein